jgi:ribosomal protein S18 acetylase RimI-like enzyme
VDIEIQYQPQITYEAFADLNDRCFKNEPISEYDFQAMKNDGFWCLVSEGALAGYCHLRIKGHSVHIRRIAVHPDYRSQGLGSRLMETMLDHSLANRANSVTLSVQQDNPQAISLYKKYGFSIVDERAQFEVDLRGELSRQTRAVPISEYDEDRYGSLPQSAARWRSAHNPPHAHVLLFVREGAVVGFARFAPTFPGCSPFEIFEDEPIDALLPLLADYALPDKRRIRITTGNTLALACFRANDYQENYRLYVMARELP